jgi:hypothetical protein
MGRLDIPFSNGNKLVVLHDDGTYALRLLWLVNKRPTFATRRVPISEAELRSLLNDDYSHVDLDELRLVADGQVLTLYFRLVFFRIEHEIWKPMMAEWLEGVKT